jgi:hypothetical protein
MKIKEYGYSKETKIGYIVYKPNFFEKMIGIKERKLIYANYDLISDRWMNIKTGKLIKSVHLDTARKLNDIQWLK